MNSQMPVQGTLQNAFYAMGLVIMGGWLLYAGRGIIVPFVMGVMVVYVIIGLADFLDHIPVIGPRLPKTVRYLISVLAISIVLTAIFLLTMSNINQVAAVVPKYQDRLLGIIQSLAVWFHVQSEPSWTTLRDDVLARIDLGGLIGLGVASLSQIVTVTAVVFIYSGFLLSEWAGFGAKLRQLAGGVEHQAEVTSLMEEINRRIGQYLALKTFVNVVLGVTSWVVMTMVGVEFAAFWAVLIGLLNYIPYLGSFVGVFFPVFLSLLQFPDFGTVVLVLVVLTAIQMFVGSVLEPYVMGNSLNLSPTVILLGLAAWSTLWGIPGAILSVPIMASILIVLASFEATRPIAVLLSRNGTVAEPIRPAQDH